MSFVPFSIDLETIIQPESQKRSQFEETRIEEIANLFLKARDTINPVIVRKISPISFEILEGYLEYYAALRAEEIDEQFTSIQAYIVPPELESTILEQYRRLRTSSNPVISNPEIIDTSEQSLINLVERTIAHQINLLKSSLQEGINTKLDQKVSEMFEQYQPAELIKSVQNIEQHIIPSDSKLLEDFNNLSHELIKNKLKAAKISNGSLLNKLVDSIIKGRPYSGSFKDFIKSDKKKLFSDKGWISLLEIHQLDLW